jgi:phosphatidylglycerophosphate synthase
LLDPFLRTTKDRVLLPVARAVGGALSPNAVTVASAAVGVAAAWMAARGAWGAALALWLGGRVLDGLDGTLARATGRQSDFGGYLDILLDFVVYTLVPIGVALGVGAERGTLLALAWLLGSFFVNSASWMYLSAVLEKRAQGAGTRGEQTTVTMPTGLIEGTETIVFYSLFLLFPAYAAPLFYAMAALVGINVVQRLVWAARHL